MDSKSFSWQFWLVVGVVFALFLFSAYDEFTFEARQQIAVNHRWQQLRDDFKVFGPEVKIVGLQLMAHQTSSKYPQTYYKEYAVVEGVSGEVRRLPLEDKPALIGEVWSVSVALEKGIYLQRRLRSK